VRELLIAIRVSRRRAVSRFEIAVILLLAFSSAPAAAQKFDLSPYFGPLPTVGDFKVFELSTGGTRTDEVVAVVPEKNGLRITSRVTETGLDPTLEEIFVIPGKTTFLGELYSGDLFIDFEKPAAISKSKAKPGKPNKIRGSGRAFFEGTLIGSAVFSGSWVFAGLEPLDTPAASYPDTAVIEVVLTLTVKSRFNGSVLRVKEESVSWQAPDIGEVATHQRITSWVDGTLVEDTGWTDEWLIDGSLAGEPIP